MYDQVELIENIYVCATIFLGISHPMFVPKYSLVVANDPNETTCCKFCIYPMTN